ncbi:hypothetical protein EMCRGX_G024727 [Ephydatia muelleri]
MAIGSNTNKENYQGLSRSLQLQSNRHAAADLARPEAEGGKRGRDQRAQLRGMRERYKFPQSGLTTF